MTITRIGYEEIDISPDVIDTTKAQARQTDVNKNVSSLAQSIETQGLFAPVLVVKLDNNKFELIAGQRRMIAHREILSKKDPEKFCKIGAFTYENTMEEWEKKAISINENFTQEPMTEQDRIGAVTACYNAFNNLKTTSERTGISYDRVRKYVKYVRLPKCLKELKDDGVISLNTALETATDFGLDSSEMEGNSEQEVKACAIETEKLTRNQKKRVRKILEEKPDKSVLETIEEVKGKPDPTKELDIVITSDSYANVLAYQQKKKIKTDSLAASELVDEGIEKNKDYLKE